LDHLNISRISGIWPYRISGRISGRAIWYPAGYRIAKKAGLSGRISGASLVVLDKIKPEYFLLIVNLPVQKMSQEFNRHRIKS
jgi:hypothetical protein